jgi:hypothetical protein
MQKKCFLLSLIGAVLLCGCDKQTKINSEKIQLLSQNIVQFEQNQTKQMAALQTQLASLAPMLDKINDFYFEKSHDDAFFYHTNTLYLLLTVDNKIESHLQTADTERAAESAQAYYYHTNQIDTMFFCAAEIRDAMAGQEKRIEGAMTGQESRIQDAMAAQEKRIEDNLNATAAQANAALRDELLKQIKLSALDATEIERLKQMETDVAQIRHDLDTIKAQVGQITNQPAARP